MVETEKKRKKALVLLTANIMQPSPGNCQRNKCYAVKRRI